MLFKEAQALVENMYKECHYETQIINKRLHDIELEIKETGTGYKMLSHCTSLYNSIMVFPV